MKRVEKEITRTDVIVNWVAADGTEFKSQDECDKYERSAKCAIKVGLNDIALNRTRCDIFMSSCYDDEMFVVVPKDASDLETINKYPCFVTGHETNGATKNDIGKPVLVYAGYCDDWAAVLSLDELVKSLTNGKFGVTEIKDKK